MNPLELISLFKGRNPQEMVMSLLQNQKINDPTINELIGLAQKGDNSGVAKIAENFFSQRGLDFNKEFSSFMSMINK